VKIGILQTGHAPEAVIPELGDYNDLFTRFLAHEAVEFVNFPVVDGVFPDDVAATFQGWIITGSRCGVYENLPWMRQLIELIRVLGFALVIKSLLKLWVGMWRNSVAAGQLARLAISVMMATIIRTGNKNLLPGIKTKLSACQSRPK